MSETQEVMVYQHLPAEFMTQKQAQIFKWFNLYQVGAVIFTYGGLKMVGVPTLIVIPLVALALVLFTPHKGEFIINRARAIGVCMIKVQLLGQPEVVDFTALTARMRLQNAADTQTAVIADTIMVGRTGGT
jgi:hypothetical protein